MKSVLVIGSGIAGLVAAIEAYNTNKNINVIILEKCDKLGGNSKKATSGISICTHPSQIQLFIQDTLKSGQCGNPRLIQLLARKSLTVLPWLKKFDINLPNISQCGGHSVPRTFTNDGNQSVGSYIVDKLIDYIHSNTSIQILTSVRVVDINNSCITLDNGLEILYDALILATGGYSSNKDLLLPRYTKLPTTNGDFATGDGLYLGFKMGGQLVDLDKVQIHPTYFVKEPILAPEALRGCGGILVNKHGQRFVDELQPRDIIVNAWPKDNLVWLVVNQDTITKFGQGKFDFYTNKNIFRKIKPKGNLLLTLGNVDEPVWIARVQPAVHYTMGGLKIDARAHVVGTIYAAGEVTGGIHGKNRLAGNSLLETIVFGRIAGRNAAIIKDQVSSYS